MKNRLKFCASVILAAYSGFACAAPPLECIAAIRDASGKVTAGADIILTAEITSDLAGENVLYSETQNLVTSSEGLMKALIGEGHSETAFDRIDWSGKRYLKTTVSVNGESPKFLGTIEIAATPVVLYATTTSGLVRTSPSGTRWELKVTDSGEPYWETIGDEQRPYDPNYDQKKVPEHLYFIGSFNNWTVAEAIPMRKISKTCFSIVRKLSDGEVFKFVPSQSWQNDRDWSSVTLNIGTPNALRESGNCPTFHETPGTYEILIDFYDYTLTITPQ